MSITFRSACFFSTDNGATVRRKASAQEEKDFPLPAGVTNLLRLDETRPNNAALLAAWATDSQPFTMSGATLLVNGQPAGIDPPGLAFDALQAANDLLTKAGSTNDAWTREEVASLVALTSFLLGRVPAYQ